MAGKEPKKPCNVTQTWFAEDVEDQGKVDTWDGMMNALRK